MIIDKINGAIAILAFTGIYAISAGTARATPLLNEPFDQYANGTTLDSTGNWTFFSPTSGTPTLPYTVNSGTVTATNLASGTSGEDDNNKFSATPFTTGILYYSMLVTVPTGTAVTSTTGDYFLAPYSVANGYAARVYLAQGSAAGTVAFGLSTAAPNTTTNPLNKTADLTLGTEYKLILRLDVAAKTATMGIFTLNSTTTPTDALLTVSSGTAGTVTGVDSVAIRQGASAAFTAIIDGIQVGTALADVSSINTGSSVYFSAVPEPSTYPLVIAGLVTSGLLLRRHRRAV